jgi:hypothetical protein
VCFLALRPNSHGGKLAGLRPGSLRTLRLQSICVRATLDFVLGGTENEGRWSGDAVKAMNFRLSNRCVPSYVHVLAKPAPDASVMVGFLDPNA